MSSTALLASSAVVADGGHVAAHRRANAASSSSNDDPWEGIFDPEIYGHSCATVSVAQALQAGLRPGAGQTKGAKKNYRKGGGVYCGPIKRCAEEFLWYGAQDQVQDNPCFLHRAV